MPSDEDLVAQAKAGRTGAFDELVQRYQQTVYSVAYRFLGKHEDACDAAQEALVRAYLRLSTFRGSASFKTWLYHIVANVCRDELRRVKRHPEVCWEDSAVAEGELDAPFESPEEVITAKEDELFLQGLLNSLPPDFRLVVVMRDIQGFSYDEIAASLGCSLGTVKSRLNRARRHLRDNYLKRQEAAASV